MNYKHGHAARNAARRSTYSSWQAMNKRCHYPKHVAYPRYGARGIVVCDRWRGENGFVNFLADMGPRPSPSHTIEREKRDGNYEPGNCRWATKSEQAFNRAPKILLTAFGKTMTIQQWSRETGVSVNAIHYRIAHGWSTEAAVSKKSDPWRRKPSGIKTPASDELVVA